MRCLLLCFNEDLAPDDIDTILNNVSSIQGNVIAMPSDLLYDSEVVVCVKLDSQKISVIDAELL